MNEINREDEIIGRNVKRFRETYGISRKELADIFHISEDGVYRIERGETGLSSSYAYILANKLHCDMNFIYGITSEPALIDVEDAGIFSLTPRRIANRLRIYADMLEELAEDDK